MGRTVKSNLAGVMCGVAATGALVLAPGCYRAAYVYDSVVTGTVTIDGELAKSGTVTFHPVEAGRPAIGRIYSDGSYSLRTGQGDLSKGDGGTIASGEYLVTASITGPAESGAVVSEGGPPKPGPSLIHKKYAQKDTTDLRCSVKPGPQVIVLDLKSGEPEAKAEGSKTDQAATQGESNAEPKVESKSEPPNESDKSSTTPSAATPAPETSTVKPKP
jgi:hypothetical protein